MSDSIASLLSTLEEAHARWRSGDLAAMLALLAPLSQAQLLQEPELGILLAWAWRNTGELEESRETMDWLTRSWGQRGNDPVYRMGLHMRAVLHLDQGELDAAERVWSELLGAAGEVGDHRRMSRACNCLGIIADIRCRFAEAIAWYERAISAARRAGDLEGVVNAQDNLSISYRQLGLLDAALDASDEALATLREVGHETLIAGAELSRAWILLARRDLKLCEATVLRARARLERTGARHHEPDSFLLLANLRLQQDRAEEAIENLTEAVTRAERQQLSLVLAQSLEDLAALRAAKGERDDAQRAARRAREIYLRMGAAHREERLRERLADLGW